MGRHVKTEAKFGVMWPQAKEAWSTRNQKRQERISYRFPREHSCLGFRICNFWDCESIICCFKLPSLWSLVKAGPGH